MFEEKSICPYTGLRSFNEEESLYFEGREKQITEITKLLEKNHFLMVTGASGDGKSSVVYAGIIPNARAGFFKSKFPNWIVADFRPEKSPLKNFSSSIAKALNIPNEQTAETEIKRGFSSLVDLYKNSTHYIDESDAGWLQLDESQQRQKLKSAANLIILVDQFEEFFTTHENFINGTPSQESQITLNVILETAKISLKENIPIYIICTMRSDYIGQCAAFRGLPEYIGFSQFFVPRLKRNQLQQVIEIPAQLSGNAISRRLVERLIYDLNEGIDQLPILQHALSQIWRIADKENEEMDLIHYAMVGGMPANELPANDQQRFLKWYKNLPEYQRRSYKTPSLENVLDIHANKLYESAAEKFNNKYPDTPIATGDAKRAIGLTFACLSRMDEGRGVRNRMTLQEVTNIINHPQLDTTTVGRLLNIFREEGNTFIRPFIDSDNNGGDLSPESVLDITHESLIRNWQRLRQWAWKESEYYETFLDFKKQLDRWIENNQSRNYLLPVGPLGYFENWYGECKPNTHWINRYQDSIENPSERLKYSSTILDQSKTFLKKSAKKHLLAKLFMKYGARNIAIAVAIISTIVLSSFYYTDAVEKQNSKIIEKIYSISEEHINNEENLGGLKDSKSEWLITGLIHNPAKTLNILQNIKPLKLKIEVPLEAYKVLLLYSPDFTGFEKDSLISIIQNNMNEVFSGNFLTVKEKLENVNLFISLLTHDETFKPTDNLYPIIQEQIIHANELLTIILNQDPSDEVGLSTEIFNSIQHINNFDTESHRTLDKLIKLISPFEETGKENFRYYFSKSSYMQNGGDQLSHNGGYHLMAEVYAALGKEKETLQAIDFILQDNNLEKYSNFESFNNFNQIFGYMLKNKHVSMFDGFLVYLEKTFSISDIKFFEDFIDRSGYYKFFNTTNLGRTNQNHPGKVNPVLSYLSPELMSIFFDYANQIISKTENSDVQNYYRALFLKHQALVTNKYLTDRNESIPTEKLDQLLMESFSAFDQVSTSYLDGEMEIIYRYYGDGIRKIRVERNNHFLYPDIYTGGYHGNRYLNGFFIDFLKRNPEYIAYYNSYSSMNLFVDWIYNGHEYFLFFDDIERIEEKLSLEQETFVQDLIGNSSFASELDQNLLNLIISNRFFMMGDTINAFNYYEKLDYNSINVSAGRGDYLNVTFFFNQIVELAINFAKLGKIETTNEIVNLISEVHFRMKTYFLIARRVHESEYPEDTYHYIGKGYDALEQFDPGPLDRTASYTFTIIETLSGLGSRELDMIVDEELKKFYPRGSLDKNIGKIKRGKYYQAMEAIPTSNTVSRDLEFYQPFLMLDNNNMDNPKWSRYKELHDRYGLARNDYIPFSTN